MIALIDSDILVYRVGFTTMEETEAIAAARMDESIKHILESLETDTYRCFLTSQEKNCFRYSIYPEYKAGRTSTKPTHYQFLRDHIAFAHGGEIAEGEEADDRLGIEQTEDTCICSIDKDLDQIPGWHFNFVKGIKYKVSLQEGIKYFYTQLLMGDKQVDNIPGITGIGIKKAEKALKDCKNTLEYFKVVKDIYQKAYPDSWESVMLRNGQLLKIRRKENELWQFPRIEPTIEVDLNT